MTLLFSYFGWICFVISTINTITFGVRYGLGDLPVNENTISAIFIIAFGYTLWGVTSIGLKNSN